MDLVKLAKAIGECNDALADEDEVREIRRRQWDRGPFQPVLVRQDARLDKAFRALKEATP